MENSILGSTGGLIILGGLTGAAAGFILGGPVGGAVGGFIFGATGILSGLVVKVITYTLCIPCLGQQQDAAEESLLRVAKEVISVVLGTIAAIATGWGVLSLMGLSISIGTAALLCVTQVAVFLAAQAAIITLVLAIFCGIACIGVLYQP